jgi:hypothetical protein
MQPSLAQDPKATRTLDFFLSTWAMCSCSLVRMLPLNKHTSMAPSSIASTSRTLASTATGQNTMSKAAATSRIFSLRARTAISHPPQEAAQYKASFPLPLAAGAAAAVPGVD